MTKKLFLVFITVWLVSMPMLAFAWDDCPFGEENDPYPGECGRYIDTDGDGICDLSQPAPEDRVVTDSSSEGEEIAQSVQTETIDTVEEAAGSEIQTESATVDPDMIEEAAVEEEHEYLVQVSGKELKALTVAELAEKWDGIPVSCLLNHLQLETDAIDLAPETTVQYILDAYNLTPENIKSIAQMVYEEKMREDAEIVNPPGTIGISEEVQAETATAIDETTVNNEPKKSITASYHVAALAVIALLIFLIGKALVKAGKMRAATEKKFLNSILLVFFIGSALTGLILSVRRDFGWFTPLPRNFLWLHAETSILMAFISIYHIVWHWKYFLVIIRDIVGGKK